MADVHITVSVPEAKEIKERLDKIMATIAEVKAAVQVFTADALQTVKDLQAKVDQQAATNASMQVQLQTAADALAVVQTDDDAVKAQLADAKQALTAAQAANDTLQQQITDTQGASTDVVNTLTEADANIKALDPGPTV